MVNDDPAARQKIRDLLGRAQRLSPYDQGASGRLLERALGETEELLADWPENLQLLRLEAIITDDLANLYTYGGRAAKAVPLLAKAERGCATLVDTGDAEASSVLADLLCRRAYSHQLLGAGASAVIYHDRVTTLARWLRPFGQVPDRQLGRLLAFNARTLAEHSDVGLAMDSARESAQLLAALPESDQAAFAPLLVEAEDIVCNDIGVGLNLFNSFDAACVLDEVPQRAKELAERVADSVRSIQDPGTEDRATSPSARVGLAHCADVGAQFSDLALAIADGGSLPSLSFFFAREANHLLAAAWSATRPAGNPTAVDPGLEARHIEPWLEAIRLCMDVCEEFNNRPLYDDYVTWLDTAAAVRDEYAPAPPPCERTRQTPRPDPTLVFKHSLVQYQPRFTWCTLCVKASSGCAAERRDRQGTIMPEVTDAPTAFVRAYERATNSHDLTLLAPLIAPDAVYWFSDGSHRGRDAVLSAIADTFATIRDEVYRIDDLEWIAVDHGHAVCRYRFTWTGTVDGQPKSGSGRGTNVLVNEDGVWRMLHEHLSA